MAVTRERLEWLVHSGTPDEWAEFINEWREEKGWNDDKKTEGDWAALAHTEISEAFEAYRDGDLLVNIVDGKPEGVAVEYADCIIRILHWFAAHGISINQTLATKMSYNMNRPYKHGGK
ncbi:hypothetical protein LCGC14_2102640, partial [marine sediment metagenome]